MKLYIMNLVIMYCTMKATIRSNLISLESFVVLLYQHARGHIRVLYCIYIPVLKHNLYDLRHT